MKSFAGLERTKSNKFTATIITEVDEKYMIYLYVENTAEQIYNALFSHEVCGIGADRWSLHTTREIFESCGCFLNWHSFGTGFVATTPAVCLLEKLFNEDMLIDTVASHIIHANYRKFLIGNPSNQYKFDPKESHLVSTALALSCLIKLKNQIKPSLMNHIDDALSLMDEKEEIEDIKFIKSEEIK